MQIMLVSKVLQHMLGSLVNLTCAVTGGMHFMSGMFRQHEFQVVGRFHADRVSAAEGQTQNACTFCCFIFNVRSDLDTSEDVGQRPIFSKHVVELTQLSQGSDVSLAEVRQGISSNTRS